MAMRTFPAGAAPPPPAPAGEPHRRRARPGPAWPVSTGLVAAFAGSAAVTAITVAVGGTRHPAVALGVLAVSALFVSLCTRPIAAPGVAVLAWMFDNGFITDRHAVLSWHGAADAWRLAILLAAAIAGAVSGARIRARLPEPLPGSTGFPDDPDEALFPDDTDALTDPGRPGDPATDSADRQGPGHGDHAWRQPISLPEVRRATPARQKRHTEVNGLSAR